MKITREEGKTRGIKAHKIMQDVIDIEIEIKTYFSQYRIALRLMPKKLTDEWRV